MLLIRLSLFLFLVAVVCALPTFHVPFSGLHLPIPSAPHLIYSSPQGHVDFRGFSYFTDDIGGGRSEVVFVTGPDSENQMNNEVHVMHDSKVAMSSDEIAEPETTASSSTTSPTETTASPEVSPGPKDEPSTTIPDLISTAAPLQPNVQLSTRVGEEKPGEVLQESQEGALQNGVENMSPPQQPSPMTAAPYPILRFGGSGSFYPQFSAGFSGYYGPSSVFRAQYDPYYSQYDPYDSSYEPYVNPYNPFVNSYNPFFGTRSSYYNQLQTPGLYQSPLFTASIDNSVGKEEPSKMMGTYDVFNAISTRVSDEKQPESAPEQAAAAPEKMSPTSEEMMSATEQVSPAPGQVTPAPEKKAAEPGPMTPDPEKMTSAPEKADPAPEQITPAPEKADPAPEQMTPAPEQPATTTEQSSAEEKIADLVPTAATT